MGEAASHISLTASGQSKSIEGHVCITATDIMSAYLLPPVLKQLRAIAPGIEIEIVSSNTISDLQRREADIAIRHVRPSQPELIAKLLRETSGHLYAATSYLDRIGRPKTPADLVNADFIGIGDNDRMISVLNDLGLSLTRDNFGISSASGVVAWELVKQGMGICVNAKEVAAITPGVECVLPDLKPVPVPIWLATHRELHTSRRIRLVFDFLADALS